MFNDLRAPFQYEKVLTKDDLRSSSTPKGNKPTATNRFKTLKRIFSYLLVYKGRLLFTFSMVVLSVAFSLLGPFLIGKAIDDYIMTKQTTGLLVLLVQLAIVYVVYSLSVFLQNNGMIFIAQHTVFRMRTDLFRHLQRLNISFFDRRQSGELMSRVTNDIDLISATLSQSLLQILSSVLSLLGAIAIMLYLSPIMTLVTLLAIPLMIFGVRWITRRTRKLFQAQQRALGDLNGWIEESLAGQRVVKTFSQEQRIIRQFIEKSGTLKGTAFWAQTYTGFIPKLMGFLNNFNFAVIAGLGGLLALKNLATVGVIVIFSEYARQFTRPLNELANQFNTVLSAIAGAERVFEMMDEPEEKADEKDAIALKETKGHIEFRDVSFSYENDDGTIRNLSFVASAGETIALVGPTGAGKTTVLHLLARFYPIDRGKILLDGVDLSTIQRESLRRQMGFVLQDPYLFRGTIRDNIRYGRFEASDEDVIEAAKRACAHEFILKLPGQYDFVLDPEGGGISQGQRQLISIARALLSNPSILLLDEATSNIDTVSEMNIQRALDQLRKGRTCIVIAHRLNTIQRADRILVLKQGRLVEQGTHEQLLAQNGFYAELFRSQT